MLYQNNANHMAQQWQRQVEESLEAGEALWLEGGLSQRAIDHIFTLTALDTLARQRSDVTAPGLFVGGDGILWAAALMSRATDSADRSTPALTLFYGGADQATYMATLATLPAPSLHTRRYHATGVPAGMQSWLLPASQPGAAPFWSSLPFILNVQTSPNPLPAQPTTSEAWLPWLTLLVVIGLVITALFV